MNHDVHHATPWRLGLRFGAYDFANSAYYLVFATLTYPLYLRQVSGGADLFEVKWGLAQGGAVCLSVLISLWFSQFTDRGDANRFWRWVPVAFVVPALMSFVFPLMVHLDLGVNAQLVLFSAVHAVYLAALTFYDASLVDISSGSDRVEVSGWAWGLGYFGGAACLVLLQVADTLGFSSVAFQLVVASVFFASTAFAAVGRMSHLHPARLPSHSDALDVNTEPKAGVVAGTVLSPADLWLLLASMVLILDGIAVFISFVALYWSENGVSKDEITLLFLALQLLAGALTGPVSMLARRGLSTLLRFCGVMWLIAGIVAVADTSGAGPWMAVALVSTVLGASQAAMRTIFSEVAPSGRPLFGFSLFAFVEKGAAFVGPILAGLAIHAVGYRAVLVTAACAIFLGTLAVAKVANRIRM